MNLYKQYIEETTDTQMLETEYGFATYTTMFNEGGYFDCYIEDIYVIPEARKTHKASAMADEIAKAALKQGCHRLLGSINLKINDPTRSMKVLLAYGFKVLNAGEGFIWFEKKLQEIK